MLLLDLSIYNTIVRFTLIQRPFCLFLILRIKSFPMPVTYLAENAHNIVLNSSARYFKTKLLTVVSVISRIGPGFTKVTAETLLAAS